MPVLSTIATASAHPTEAFCRGVLSDAGVQITDDGGQTWRYAWKPAELILTYPRLWFINADEGWMTTGNKVMHTEDGGDSWDVLVQLDDFRLLNLYFFDESHTCMIGNSGIYRTEDGGRTWERTGQHAQRDRAAHWDGLTQTGEPAASGICSYTVRTDSMTTTRRMVLVK